MRRATFILIVGALGLAACATTPSAPEKSPEELKSVDIGGHIILQLPQPRDVTGPVRVVQTVTMKHDGKTKTFEVIFENQNNKMVMAVITPLWPTPLKASYDGETVHVDGLLKSNLPFDMHYILADIILVVASDDNLKKWLSAGANISSEKQHREISSPDSGKVIDIIYDDPKLFHGKTHLKNLLRNYEIDVDNVKVDAL